MPLIIPRERDSSDYRSPVFRFRNPEESWFKFTRAVVALGMLGIVYLNYDAAHSSPDLSSQDENGQIDPFSQEAQDAGYAPETADHNRSVYGRMAMNINLDAARRAKLAGDIAGCQKYMANAQKAADVSNNNLYPIINC